MNKRSTPNSSKSITVSFRLVSLSLSRGSGFQNGKYRIYRQLWKGENSKDNIAFLKREYGTGGGTHDYPDGTRGGVWCDAKGIAIEKYGSYTDPDLRLSWSKVEKRLRELIKNDRYLNPKEKEHYPDYLEKAEAPQYEIDTQRKIQRQNFINAKRDLPPADKRDTLALRLSDFIRDLNGYEKDLLFNVERTDLSDVTEEQMEQHLSDPATVQQLIDFLKLVQGQTSDVYSRSNAWRFGQELLELHPLHYLYHESDHTVLRYMRNRHTLSSGYPCNPIIHHRLLVVLLLSQAPNSVPLPNHLNLFLFDILHFVVPFDRWFLLSKFQPLSL